MHLCTVSPRVGIFCKMMQSCSKFTSEKAIKKYGEAWIGYVMHGWWLVKFVKQIRPPGTCSCYFLLWLSQPPLELPTLNFPNVKDRVGIYERSIKCKVFLIIAPTWFQETILTLEIAPNIFEKLPRQTTSFIHLSYGTINYFRVF